MLDKAYVPKFALQGEEVPLYLLWNKSKNISIDIILPKEFKIKEINNVDESNFSIDENVIKIKKTETNGYFSMIFESGFYGDAVVNESIFIKAIYGEEETKIEKIIELFRAKILVDSYPKRINVAVDDFGRIKTDAKIVIENKGKGTALINLETKDNSEIKKIDSESFHEFSKKFWGDIEINFKLLIDKYPEYTNIINEFIRLGKDTRDLSEILHEYEELESQLDKVFESNEMFFKEFAGYFINAYLKNVSIITEISSFVAYLESTHKGKIVLFDPLKIIKVDKEPKKLNSEIMITDLNFYDYDPISLNEISIKCNKECEIPIHNLFEFIKTGSE